VEELFEARPVKKAAVISEVDGRVESVEEVVAKDGKARQKLIKVQYTHLNKDHYPLSSKNKKALKVKDGQGIDKGDILYETKSQKVLAKSAGIVKIKDDGIQVVADAEEVMEYLVSPRYNCWIKAGDLVKRGDQLTEGSIDLHQLYRLRGKEAVEKYILKDIQYIYSSQGQKLNDKHIEIIIRKMFSRFYVKDSGDTDLLLGEIVERAQLVEANDIAKKEGKQEAIADNLLLGITKASLSTESFLSAASFQETARVLIDAAISGKVDKLRGKKG
jgi:DNA-directed RNA polymerase subunit beta'